MHKKLYATGGNIPDPPPKPPTKPDVAAQKKFKPKK